MSKVPKTLNVKFQISDFQLEIPKSFFENAGARVAIFVGRKGKSALTRRSKWFTVADISELPTSSKLVVKLTSNEEKSLSRRGSAVVAEGADDTKEEYTDMAVLKFGALNTVEYDVEMHPINKFDGEWVFNQETSHPLTIFAKVITKNRPGVKGNNAASEKESNLNEMMDIDAEDIDDEDFSGDDEKNAEEEDDEDALSLSGIQQMGLTAEQVKALTGETRTEDQVLVEHLITEKAPIKRRYLRFPKQLDVADVVNTKAKSQDFSERVKCKSAALVGTTMSFKVTAIIPKDEIEKHEEKNKEKEEKEEKKRREKEEKLLEKERKKQEKADKKANKGKKDEGYGVDVTHNDDAGGAQAREGEQHVDAAAKPEKKSKNPFTAIKGAATSVKTGIFGGPADKNQVTPFPLKYSTSAYPYLILLDKFELRDLKMPAEFYRAVHIRLGSQSNSADTFPLLLLDATKAEFQKEEQFVNFDGTQKTRQFFDFDDTHIFFGHKHIRNVTGFDTLKALEEHEKKYFERKALIEKGEEVPASHLDSLQSQLLDVGEKFTPVLIEPSKYSSNDAQGKPTKYTRVVASLIIPKSLNNVPIYDEDAAKKEYLKKLKKEHKEQEKAEKEAAKQREKAEKEAAKRAQAGAGEDVAGEDDVHSDTGSKAEGEKKEESVHEEAKEETEKAEGEEKDENEEGGEHFESEGTAQVEMHEQEANPKKAPSASAANKVVDNKTKSLQLPTYVLDEEYIPKEGIHFVIKFKTGERLHFRVRRIFLPSINSAFGDKARAFNELTLNEFYEEEDKQKKAEK